MEVAFLETFLVVVEAGSMAEAARRLDLAPTTVAQQIRSLEADLGCRLLGRAGRTVRPTPAGRRMLDRARLVVRTIRDLRSDASEDALPAGPLRLGATPTGLMGLLPPVLKHWRARHPGIGIAIEPGTSAWLIQRLASEDLDAAIVVQPAYELPKSCGWTPIRSESLVLLTPADMVVDDPLATVVSEPYIRYDRSVVAGRMADDYLRGRGLMPQAQFELDGIEQIARLVAAGLGVSVLPDWPTTGPPDHTTRRWPLPAPCPTRTVGLLWHRASVRTPLAMALGELLTASQR